MTNSSDEGNFMLRAVVKKKVAKRMVYKSLTSMPVSVLALLRLVDAFRHFLHDRLQVVIVSIDE